MVLCAIEMGSGRRTSEELENQRPLGVLVPQVLVQVRTTTHDAPFL